MKLIKSDRKWLKKYILRSTTAFNNDNKKECFWNHQIMISDAEDWRNDAENSALHHRNKLHFNIYSNRKQLF